MKKKIALLWFRNDLRLHDHEALHLALDRADEVIPVYCFDPRHFGETPFGFPKTGAFRAQFLRESVENLRQRLRAKGSDLLVLQGQPEILLPELAQRMGAYWIFAHQEVAYEETRVEAEMEKALFPMGITLETAWGATLYHPEDLPMPLSALPDVFTNFRKQTEKYAPIRALFPTPERIPSPTLADVGELPSWEWMGLEPPQRDARQVLPFAGGEEAGIERLQEYFWERNCLKDYKETRNGLLGEDYSSKFSAWLSLGCLSPRYIHKEVKRYEDLRVANSSTYWLIFELLWRDYFRFVAKRHGNSLFHRGGIRGEWPGGQADARRFVAWKEGRTGVPFIDANMRELLLTGFMSNRGRQNVASFLVKDLQLDWRMGAEWFESQLIDYDVCSNWGNWNYVAGIGNDPRENRYFNVVSQGRNYDGKGEYIRTWVPEIASLPSDFLHEPGEVLPSQLAAHGVRLGHQYPFPILAFSKKAPRNR